MPTVIPVKFQFATRDLWFDPASTGASEGDHVICKTERGTEIGLATGDAVEVEAADLEKRGVSQLKPVLRVATEEDLARAEELADKGEQAIPTFRRLIEASGLDMKPVGVEYLFGGEKVVCYFAAEERQDFRQLVRDLARELHERIDMRQIGVREEAAVVGGYAHCGQELCCARFGNQFEPVSIRMAKEQDLPLNSSKISGACGRLMCCLRYEFEAYRDFKGRAPKKNAVIQTPLGKAKIIEYDTPKEQIALRLESGKTMRIALADMTASEAACKKAEELGCACRPDTVAREVLDKLDSADIRMALANLDREMGVLQDDSSADDLFVETSRKRRSRRGGQGSTDGDGAAAGRDGQQQAGGSGESQGQRKRRRSRGGQKGGSGSGQQGQQGQAAGQQRQGSAGAGSSSGDGQQQSRRRRRHHSDGAGQAGAASSSGSSASQGAGQASGQQATRTHARKPGDRGGAHMAQSVDVEGGASAGSGNGSGGSGSRRRRHRRRGSGSADGSGSGSAPAGE